MKRLAVLLVEDSALFRSALTNLFSLKSTFNVVVCSSSSFLKKLPKLACDVIVIDAVTWSGGMKALVEGVRNASTCAPTLLLGREDLIESHLPALRAGAVGFIKQTAPPRVVFNAVKTLAKGGVSIDASLFRRVVSPLMTEANLKAELSQKEQQIANLIAGGKTNKEIGASLGLTERTVKWHVSNLCRKMGVPNRSAMVSYVISHSLIQFSPSK